MAQVSPATLIAERIPNGGLVHPGDPETGQKPFAIPLPGLRATGIPPEMQAEFATTAGLPHTDTPRLIGEAIVHLLDEAGFAVNTTKADLDELRQQAADAPDCARAITVRCACHGHQILQLTVGKRDEVTVTPALLIAALRNHDDEAVA